jgi:hypothetical protein
MPRHCTRFRLCAGLAGSLAVALLGLRTARAYEEQASLDGSLGYALIVPESNLPAHGAMFDLGAGIGLGDIAVLRGSLGYAFFRDDSRDSVHGGRLRIEALYLLDVLKVVPFFGLGGSLLLASAADNALRVRPGGHVVLGVDYLASRRWVVGLDVRPGVLVEDGRVRSATEVALRVSRMFELF